jgi:hypothetical protein
MRRVNGHAKTVLASLGAGALVWLALDYMSHKTVTAALITENELALAGIRWNVTEVRKGLERQCRLMMKIAERLKIDTAAVDCGKE